MSCFSGCLIILTSYRVVRKFIIFVKTQYAKIKPVKQELKKEHMFHFPVEDENENENDEVLLISSVLCSSPIPETKFIPTLYQQEINNENDINREEEFLCPLSNSKMTTSQLYHRRVAVRIKDHEQ